MFIIGRCQVRGIWLNQGNWTDENLLQLVDDLGGNALFQHPHAAEAERLAHLKVVQLFLYSDQGKRWLDTMVIPRPVANPAEAVPSVQQFAATGQTTLLAHLHEF